MADIEKDIDGADDFEPDIVDLDGEPFEIIDALTHEGVNYLALIPYSEEISEDEEEETEFIVLQEVEQDGEYFLSTIDDDKLAEKIGELFLAHFEELFNEYE